jgi:hypothetical protein
MAEYDMYGDMPGQALPVPELDAAQTKYQDTEVIGSEDLEVGTADDPGPELYDDTADIGVGDCGAVEADVDEPEPEPVPPEPALGAVVLAANIGPTDGAEPASGIDAPEPLPNQASDMPTPASTPAETTETAEVSGTPETARPQDVVTIKVVPTAHNPANAPAIADAVADCRTVVFEIAGGSPEVRADLEALANIQHRHPDIDTRVQASELLESAGDTKYISATINRLPATVESIKFADVDSSRPEYATAEEIPSLMADWSETTQGPVYNDAPGGSREKAEQFVRHAAKSSLEREPIMAGQIADIAADIAHSTDATSDNPYPIGFVTGMGHVGTNTHLEANGFNTTVEPAVPISPFDGTPIVGTYGGIVSDLVASGDPNGPIDTARLDRATVELSLRSAGQAEHLAAAIAQGMTDGEVQKTLDGVDFMRAMARGGPLIALSAGIRNVLARNAFAVAERLKRDAGRD